MVPAALLVLSTFDKSPDYIIDRLLWRMSDTSEPNPLVFLPQYYYEDLDALPHTYNKNVETLEDFHEWKHGPVIDEYRVRPTIHQVPHDATMVPQ